MSPYFLYDCVENTAVVRASPACWELIEEAKRFHLLPDRRLEYQTVRTRQRNCAAKVQVQFLSIPFILAFSTYYSKFVSPIGHCCSRR